MPKHEGGPDHHMTSAMGSLGRRATLRLTCKVLMLKSMMQKDTTAMAIAAGRPASESPNASPISKELENKAMPMTVKMRPMRMKGRRRPMRLRQLSDMLPTIG